MKKTVLLIGLFVLILTLPCMGRYFDPTIGRWLVPDPLAGKYPSISPYVYCVNNPLKFVDPDGRDFKISSSANSNQNFNKTWSFWQSTEIGQNVLSQIANNSTIMVYYDVGQSKTMHGVTNHQDPGIVKIAKRKGSNLVTAMDNNVTVKQTGAKDGQKIIIVTVNENSIKIMNPSEASKILNHESQAHVSNDPQNKRSTSQDHAKYSGTNPDGTKRTDENAAPGTQADQYNKEVEKRLKENEKN